MSNRVLFVDDDPKILAAFQRQLRKKVTVETVESGAEGLEVLRRNGPFSVVVTDYCMPSMNGIEFLGRAREIASSSGAPSHSPKPARSEQLLAARSTT